MKEKFSSLAVWFLFAVGLIAVYKAFDRIEDLFSWAKAMLRLMRPFFDGAGIAFLLLPPAKRLEKLLLKIKKPWLRRRARTFSVAGSLIGFILLLALMLFWFVPALYQSLTAFIFTLPGHMNQVYATAVEYFGHEPWLKEALDQLAGQLDFQSILEWLGALNISSYAAGLTTIFGQLLDLFLGMVLSIYILADRASLYRNLMRGLRLICRRQTVAELTALSARLGNVLYSFLYGQAMDALFVGAASWLGFTLLKVPNAAMLGFFYGLFSLIPYFGAFIGVFMVAVFTLISGGLGKCLIALAFILVLQQIDGNIVNPKIIGSSIGIKPLYVIFSVTLFGGIFGIPGMLLGPPIMAILCELTENFVQRQESQKLDAEEETAP